MRRGEGAIIHHAVSLPQMERGTKMKDLKEFRLDEAGELYMAECIRWGNTLSSFVTRNVDLKQGYVHTYAPPETTMTKLADFNSGGLVKARHTTTHLVDMIQTFLSGGTDRIVILEDVTLRKGDPYLDVTANEVLFHGDEVYYLLRHDAGANRINLAVTDAGQNRRFVGLMTMSAQLHQMRPGQRDATAGLLDELSRHTQRIFVGAYDDEGYVIWTRSAKTEIDVQ
jgi:hypothetical protein